jgi:hypothetical protein
MATSIILLLSLNLSIGFKSFLDTKIKRIIEFRKFSEDFFCWMFLLLSGRVVAKKNRKNVPGKSPGTFAIVCIYERLLTLDSCYAWENLTLDGLEQSTTTS